MGAIIMKNIFKANGKYDIGALIISLLISEGLGFVARKFTPNSSEIYKNLAKPFFSPPTLVFGVVWPILYALMAIAAYRIWLKGKEGKNVRKALVLYTIQLILNFLCTFIFFQYQLFGLAFIEILFLLIFIILTTIEFFKVDKISGILMLPYTLWVAFAAVLNYFIWVFNEM